MKKCPHCQNEENQVKSGFNRSGSQRWKCQICNKRYTPQPKEQGYSNELRHQAVRLYIDGMNYRRVARHLRVDHKSVINWVNAYAAQLEPASVPNDVNNAEMDELFTFIGSKKQSLPDDDSG
jgi:transposase